MKRWYKYELASANSKRNEVQNQKSLQSDAMFSSKVFLLATSLSCLATATSSQIPVLQNLRSRRPITAAASSQRGKTCLVNSYGDGLTDDSGYVLSAFEECNDGGREYYEQDDEMNRY